MKPINLKQILIKTGVMCQYCEQPTELVDSAVIYGRSFGNIFLCQPCDAYVGTHEDTGLALGSVANRELRGLRKMAHFYFDQIFQNGLINKIWPDYIPETSNRKKAYLWLSKQMGIAVNDCHIALFDAAKCNIVVEICRKELLIKS